MTAVSLDEFRKHIDHYLAQASRGEILLTQDGKPWVVLRSVEEDQDRLSAAYSCSAEFWQMIQKRREEYGIPWEEAKKQLDLQADE